MLGIVIGYILPAAGAAIFSSYFIPLFLPNALRYLEDNRMIRVDWIKYHKSMNAVFRVDK